MIISSSKNCLTQRKILAILYKLQKTLNVSQNMNFFCPQCQSANLSILYTLELPPDAVEDEINLQALECQKCGFHGAAVYRESRRGALDSDSYFHEGYFITPENYQKMSIAMKACPDPQNARCPCPSHQWLGEQVNYYWNGLEKLEINPQNWFSMQISPSSTDEPSI